MKKIYHDNAKAPIIAWDFDGTLCRGKSYPDPHNGRMAPHMKECIGFLHDIGVVNVLWTNRKRGHDKEQAEAWLIEHGVHMDAINNSSEFAPWKYYGRKMYAHLYVDDRNFMGLKDDGGHINPVDVVHFVLHIFLGADPNFFIEWINDISDRSYDEIIAYYKPFVTHWKDED